MQQLRTLPELIIDRIQKENGLSFRDFMEMALYHPEFGYYTSDRAKIGDGGDFYTSASLTALYGGLLARQLEEMWRVMGHPPFTIVEYGAGTGLLCRDILQRLRQIPAFYEKLNYFIIEKSGAMRAREREILPEKVGWREAIGELAPVTGCVLSNELVDNFSVHQVVMEEELMEVCVTYDGGFREMLRPAPEPLAAYLRALGVSLPRGFRAEINLEATQWIGEVAEALERGFVLTVDYGYPSSVLYSRRSGTLACYHRHRVHHCPYELIGEQDITSHVNFSALDHWGRRHGLVFLGYTSQRYFLQGLGLAHSLRQWEEQGPQDPEIRERQGRQLRTFLAEMGPKFKVLIQYKGMEKPFLSGLQFPEPLA